MLRASAGSSGGAVGSSQSPNWKPLSHSRLSPASRGDASTQARMLSNCAASMPRVAEALVEHPRHDHRGVAPGRRGGVSGRRQHMSGRRTARRRPGVLLGGEVGSQDARKPAHVVEEAGGGREHLDVAGPAQPLVALRAVGRDVEEVAAHAPDDVLVQPVEQRVGALEPAGALHVGVADDRAGRRRARARPASRRSRRSGSRGR